MFTTSSQPNHNQIASNSKNQNKKKPFIINREPSMKTPSCGDKRSYYAGQESRALVPKNEQLEAQNKILASQTAFKNCYNLFKVSPNLLTELLQKYADANLKYRDEEFTQQSDNFLTKIASSKKIPKDLKAKYPIYYILVSLCKIFMLNEYEIVVLACALDHCSWKIDETVYPEEESLLKEFPGNLGPEIDSECKRLIIYLLVITFSLKQYLNEKSEVDKIHAYCENICTNFQAIFNRWTRVSFYHKFNYSPLEINRKFRYLCQKEELDLSSTNKDYNNVVDSIMGLTGAYKSKISIKPMPANSVGQPQQQLFHHPTVFADIQLPPMPDVSVPFTGIPVMPTDFSYETGLSKPMVLEPAPAGNDLGDLPPAFDGLSRRMSSSTNLFGEEQRWKKPKLNSSFLQSFPGFSRENSVFKEFSAALNNSVFKNIDPEEFMNLAQLPLSKKSSMSQTGDEPNFFRFHSILSSWHKE